MKTIYFSSMTSGIVALIVATTFLMILNYFAKRLTNKVIKEAESQIESENESIFIPPATNHLDKTENKSEDTEPIILQVRDDNSSSNPQKAKDMNDIQNLSKYNHNTYRASNGRFKSLKEV